MTEGHPPGPKRSRRRNRKPPRDDIVYYAMEIKGWEWSFSFGINASKHAEGPYSDYLGAEHPDTAMSLSNPATLLLSQGDLAGARPLHERALAIREKMPAAERPDTGRHQS